MDRLFVAAAGGFLLLACVLVIVPPFRRWMGRQWAGLLACAIRHSRHVARDGARGRTIAPRSAKIVSPVGRFVADDISPATGSHAGRLGRVAIYREFTRRSRPGSARAVGGVPNSLHRRKHDRVPVFGRPRILAARIDGAAERRGPEKPVWVGNIGRSGFCTTEHLKFIQDSPLIGEIDCVVLLVGYNDLIRLLHGELTRQLWDDIARKPATVAQLERTVDAAGHPQQLAKRAG